MESIDVLLQPYWSQRGPKSNQRPVAAIIGSGGKTTMLWTLAQSFRHEKVLACTTVRMFPPPPDCYDNLLQQENAESLGDPCAGITFAGSFANDEGKVGSFSLDYLDQLIPRFDRVLIEADGSRRLPFKGWAAYEPVVPEAVTLTLVVIPVLPEGAMVTEEFVHRIPLFCDISGALPGQAISSAHIAKLLAHSNGPLKNAKGNVVLFFNKVATSDDVARACEVLALLPKSSRKLFCRVLAGSAKDNAGVAL